MSADASGKDWELAKAPKVQLDKHVAEPQDTRAGHRANPGAPNLNPRISSVPIKSPSYPRLSSVDSLQV